MVGALRLHCLERLYFLNNKVVTVVLPLLTVKLTDAGNRLVSDSSLQEFNSFSDRLKSLHTMNVCFCLFITVDYYFNEVQIAVKHSWTCHSKVNVLLSQQLFLKLLVLSPLLLGFIAYAAASCFYLSTVASLLCLYVWVELSLVCTQTGTVQRADERENSCSLFTSSTAKENICVLCNCCDYVQCEISAVTSSLSSNAALLVKMYCGRTALSKSKLLLNMFCKVPIILIWKRGIFH